MKAGRAHRVPLSGATLALLRSIRPADGDGDVDGAALVFAAPRGDAFQASALSRAVRELKLGGTLHGFRSSFRDWAAETGQGRDVAEAALAHSIAKNMTEAAYLRTDMLAARVPLMEAWAKARRAVERPKQPVSGSARPDDMPGRALRVRAAHAAATHHPAGRWLPNGRLGFAVRLPRREAFQLHDGRLCVR